MNNVVMFSLPLNTHLPSAQALVCRKVKGCFCSLQVGAAVQRWALSLCGVFPLKSHNNHLRVAIYTYPTYASVAGLGVDQVKEFTPLLRVDIYMCCSASKDPISGSTFSLPSRPVLCQRSLFSPALV